MAVLEKGYILENTYEIIEEIGSGGGGVVFRAKHLRLNTDVVVKKIKDEVRGKICAEREADILKNLKHSYLPRIYDFIETKDGVYTVMDFIKGESLDKVMKKNPKYSQKQVRKWAEQLGEALAYLHEQKPPIIHSDIKPANIMLTNEGDVCLIDFNISLAMGTDMKSAVGISAGFSPPEQYQDAAFYEKVTHSYTVQKQVSKEEENTELISEDEKTEIIRDKEEDKTEIITYNGDVVLNSKSETGRSLQYTKYIGKGIDTRSDIYSLGVTLYFLLTGLDPSPDFSQRIPLCETNVRISEGFAVILEKMMDLSPDKRYQNGKEFLKAIKNCHKLDHRYVVMHRKQTGIQAAAIGCLALGILLVFGGVYQIRRERNGNYYMLIQQAREAMNLYDYESAAMLLDEAKEIFDQRISAYEEEVYLLYTSEKYEDCIELGEGYINTAPFLVESEEDREQLGNIYYLIGNAYFEIEDYPSAKRLFEYALTYHTQNGLYYRDYAITAAKMGQLDEAEAQLQRGIELGMAQDSIYMAQGEIAHAKGMYEEAVEYLKETIRTTTDERMKQRAIFLCIGVYKTIGNEALDEEIALLEQYREGFSGNGNLVMTEYLADAYVRKAQADESDADVYYQKAITLFHFIYEKGYVTYQIQENMAILYENMDNFVEAEALLLQMAESYPERYEVYKRLAYLEADRQQMFENANRDYEQMRSYYEKAKELYEEDEPDPEMEMLENMMQELVDGGWL